MLAEEEFPTYEDEDEDEEVVVPDSYVDDDEEALDPPRNPPRVITDVSVDKIENACVVGVA